MKIGIKRTVKTPTYGETITALTMQVLPDGLLGLGMQIEMPNKVKTEYVVAIDPTKLLKGVLRILAARSI